jgi:glycosyltransferase involved in cell wall biosynthesis/acetyltransferase-like isoleucine patch superfamily enzyme
MTDRIPFAEQGVNVTVYPMAKIIQPENMYLGSNIIIDDFCFIVGGKRTEMGDYIHLASYVSFTGAGEVYLEDFVQIAQGSCLLTGTDDFTGAWGGIPSPTIPPKYRSPKRSFVRMERHSVLGQGCRVMPGVTIGEGCSVGSMSLITRDLPPWTLCYGIPAKPVKERVREHVLRYEKELRADNEKPMVSICCPAYNQVHLIRSAIDGFLMQKTNFAFEVIIHDDGSTDGTADVIMEYARRFPSVVKPIIQKENTYSKTGEYPTINLYRAAKGKYIAECDGDDYWQDPLKLQKQFDFLEANPDYSMCHHDYLIETGGKRMKPHDDPPKDFTSLELIKYPLTGHGISVTTRMFRNMYSDKTAADIEVMAGDYSMLVYMGTFGKCKFMPGIVPSIYRRMNGTNSWCSLPEKEKTERTRLMYRKVFKWFVSKGNAAHIEMRRAFL